jgi:hypothetical protein
MAGLAACLDTERLPGDDNRAAEARPLLMDAAVKLGESAPLSLRNLSFCTAVQSYGCTKRFDKYEFTANQEMILYAEVENFVSTPTSQGYHVSLQSNYRIVDASGQVVTEQKFSATEENCQNIRRDFFIGYRVQLPKTIQPGKYTLQLDLEDLACHKTGQAAIEFVVIKGSDSKSTNGTKPASGSPPGQGGPS